jgi:hypothetical protein
VRTTLGPLADDVARRLVFAQAPERRVAEASVVGPLGELDLGHELGPDPVDAGGAGRPAMER